MDLKETDALGDHIADHWYYRSKAKAMERFLEGRSPSVILDVGAGSGFFSRKLLADTEAQEAWCVDTGYSEPHDAVENGKPVHYRQSIGKVNADLVLLMDVLEHVDDDVGLLRSYQEKVPRGAKFLISVPAFQFLWSSHDVFLEHKRRYRLNQIEVCTRNAGLQVLKGAYYFGGVFPLAAISRLGGVKSRSGHLPAKSQLIQHHPMVNKALSTLCEAELPVMPWNRWVGLTAFCLAQKS